MNNKLNESIKIWRPPFPLTGNGWFFGRIGCLDENTRIDVIINNKVFKKKIKDLPEQFELSSYNLKSKSVLKNDVAIKIDSGYKECYEMILYSNKKVIATKEHRFLTKETYFNKRVGHKFKRLDCLSVDDIICCINNESNTLTYDLIKSIKKVGKRKTYDLQVKENNNFFLSNGILSHNSGKSFKLKAVVEFYYEKGYKIWDMFGGKRGEGPFWSFPSDEMKLWREYEKEVGLMKHYGPKEYPVLLVYPYFKEYLPDKLPELKPRISTQVMTIYFKDITADDISLVLGNMSSNAKYVWNYILKTLPDDASGSDILNLYNTKLKKYKDLNLYKNFIEPLVYQQILAGKDCQYNLDLVEISKNKKEVFVLCDDYIPKQYKLFIMGYILRKLFYDYIMKDKTHKYNIAMFREMSTFMKVVDSNNQDDVQIQNFRNFICDIARYARSGLFVFGDTQSPCLDENTEIYHVVNNKIKISKIKDLPKSFNTFSYNFEKNKFEIKKGIKKLIGEKNTLKIEFDEDNVVATPEHRFFINNNQIFAKDLKVGDDILNFTTPISEICRRIKISTNTKKAMKNPLIREKIKKGLTGKKQSLDTNNKRSISVNYHLTS